MIVTSLAANGDTVWTGGWDGAVRQWTIAGDRLQAAGEISLGACINGLVATAPNTVYAAVSGGRLVRIAKS